MTLYESENQIGGQFNIAKMIPGKEEFNETLRYFSKQLELNKVQLILGRRVSAEDLISEKFDEVVLSTGVVPRKLKLPGFDNPKVMNYIEAILKRKPIGNRVAIIGAGGIGFDVAVSLLLTTPTIDSFLKGFFKDSKKKSRT